MKNRLKRIDILITDLCDEVDHWRNKYEMLREEYDELNVKHSKLLNSSLDNAKAVTGKILNIMCRDGQKRD